MVSVGRSSVKVLLWYDLETTGSSSVHDEVLEVGACVTDLELNDLGEPFESVLSISEKGLARVHSSSVVASMHAVSGLLQEAKASHVQTWDVDIRMSEWLASFGFKRHEYLSAGSGVSHFDRRFVQRDFPTWESWMAYPNFDIGVARRVFSYLGADFLVQPEGSRSFGPAKEHRALADVRAHLGEARWLRAQLGSIRALLEDEVTQS